MDTDPLKILHYDYLISEWERQEEKPAATEIKRIHCSVVPVKLTHQLCH